MTSMRAWPARRKLVVWVATIGALATQVSFVGTGVPDEPILLLAPAAAVLFAMVCDMGGTRPALWLLAALAAIASMQALVPSFALRQREAAEVFYTLRGVTLVAAVAIGFFVFPVLAKVMVTWTPAGERARVQGTYWVVVWAFAAAWIVVRHAWDSAFGSVTAAMGSGAAPIGIGATLAVLLGLLAHWYCDDPRDHDGVVAAERALLSEVAVQSELRAEHPLRTVLRMPETWILGAIAGVLYLARAAAASAHGRSDSAGGMALEAAAPWLGAAAGALLVPLLQPDLIRRRGGVHAGLTYMAGLTSIVAAVLVALGGTRLGSSPVLVAVTMEVAVIPLVIVWVLCMRAGGRYTATVVAVVAFLASLGPVLGGFVKSEFAGRTIIVLALLVAAVAWRHVPSSSVALEEPMRAEEPGAGLGAGIASMLCYFPFIQLWFLTRTSTRRSADLRFHAWQGLFAWMLYLLGIPLVTFLATRLLPIDFGPIVHWARSAAIAVIAVIGLIAFGRPDFRLPLLSRPAEWITRPAKAGEQPSFFGSRAARFVAAVVMAIGAGAIAAASVLPFQARAAGSILVLLGGYLLIFGRRMGALSARLALARTSAAPVLYLRSFSTDAHDEGEEPRWVSEELLGAHDEHILASLFGVVGPVVAVGRPGERLPRLGAARMYFRNEDWQEGVRNLMQRAQLVVLRVGTSRGFLWEVQNVVRTVPPERIVLYFSHRLYENELQRMYEDFTTRAADAFPRPLPASIGRERFLVFDEHWNPRLIGAVPTTRWTPARMLAPPLGAYLEEVRVRTRLARSLETWFSARGLHSYHARLFGPGSIALGGLAAGPVGSGAMLTWNLLRTGFGRRAMATIVAAALLSVAYFAGFRGATRAGAQAGVSLNSVVAELFAYSAFALATPLMPGPMRDHFRLGGRTVRGWVTALLVVAMLAGWWGFTT